MTPKEAYESLCYEIYEEDHCSYIEEELDIAIKALEKQMPKKPVYYTFGKEKYPKCPCCGDNWNMDEYGSGMVHCWECGQAIDWSEEEE